LVKSLALRRFQSATRLPRTSGSVEAGGCVAAKCTVAARHFEDVDRRCDSQITDGVHGDLQPGTVGCEHNGL